MHKIQRFALFLLRLTFLAASLPIPVALHGQTFLHKQKVQAAQPVQQVAAQLTAVQPVSPNSDPVSQDLKTGLSPKQPGTIRIGVLLPAISFQGSAAVQDAEPLRLAELKLLAGPNIQAVALKEILPEKAREEAALLDCDYVLSSTVAQSKSEGGSRFSKLGALRGLQMATSAAQFVPGVSMTAIIATTLVSTAAMQAMSATLSGLTHNMQANAEVVVGYTLTSKTGVVALSGSEKARSKSDGDDVLPGLLAAASQKILGATKP